MKSHKLRLVAIATAILACWWCASNRSPLPSPSSADAAASRDATAAAAETTQACQAVVDRMVTIQQFVMDEKLSNRVAAMDELVAQENRIDASKCPADFRLAVSRIVTTENSARTHANADQSGNANEALLAGMEIFATRNASANKSAQSQGVYNEKITDDQNQDLANVRSALRDFVQLATKYGVK
jgi:hypothetical protein